MKYPMINKQPRREVNIPELSAGFNLRDGLTAVKDNQMTDCVNMWYKDGMLRTRPPFVTNENMATKMTAVGDTNYILNIKTHTDVRNGNAVLVSAIRCDGEYGKNGCYWQMGIQFWWQYPDSADKIDDLIALEIPDFVWVSEESLFQTANTWSRFVTAKDGVAYCYASDDEKFYIHKLDYTNGATEWEKIETYDFYAPTIYAHCQRTGWDDFEGTQFEGYNLISNSYKMIYSAYNEADSDSTHPMRYKLGQELATEGIIKVEITTYDSTSEEIMTVEHSIQYSADDYENFSKGNIKIETFGAGNTSDDGLRLFVKYNYVGFVFAAIDDGVEGKEFFVAMLDTDEKVRKYGCNEDNVVITAQYNSTDDWKKVFGMTQSIWFGGAANGIYGGSRLFLCGNTKESEKSLVVWSGLNNPLYFNENNYAYVGDKSQAVTAFGQQGENLIIFKERSTYYSYYTVNDNITADSLTSQAVVDYEANSVYFPMIQLNSSIGCDCPNTVQLCRNRLVWANSDGNIYTLYSNNQYSERTIYKVSDMVYSALCKENDLKNAVSCDFEGHYLLGVGNKIYVMDYNSYGYQYASSFSKTEDSNTQIPWYVWTFDNSVGDSVYTATIYETNNKLMLLRDFQTGEGVTLTFSTLSENTSCDSILICDPRTDELCLIEKDIESKMQTKLFDFSAAGYLKNIDRVSVGFGNNNGAPINVSFVTNAGSQSDTVELYASQTDEREASFVTVKNFYPTMRSVQTFGVRIECDGMLAVDGISLQYRLLGGVK